MQAIKSTRKQSQSIQLLSIFKDLKQLNFARIMSNADQKNFVLRIAFYTMVLMWVFLFSSAMSKKK